VRITPGAFGVLIGLMAAGRVQAQKQFEGMAVYRTSTGGRSAEITYYSKGTKLRQEISAGGTQAATITDYTQGKSITLIPAQKKYMVMDYKAMGKALKPLADKLGEKDPGKPAKAVLPKFTPTGQRETVAGHSCEHFRMKGDDSTVVDFCVARDLGFFMFGGASLGVATPEYAVLANEFKDGFFPLKISVQKGAATRGTFEAVRIERKVMPAAMFEIPAGYTALAIPSIPGLPGRPRP
jgi:hypothetical protein